MNSYLAEIWDHHVTLTTLSRSHTGPPRHNHMTHHSKGTHRPAISSLIQGTKRDTLTVGDQNRVKMSQKGEPNLTG